MESIRNKTQASITAAGSQTQRRSPTSPPRAAGRQLDCHSDIKHLRLATDPLRVTWVLLKLISLGN